MPEVWTDFNVALGAASAALAGLIMVAISVNIKQVLKYPGISARAAAALAILVLVLVGSLVALMPGQSAANDGWFMISGCVIVWVIALHGLITMVRTAPALRDGTPATTAQRAGWLLGNSVLYLVPLVLMSAGSVLLVLGTGDGAYWIAVGSIAGLAGSVMFSWVALVEILR